MRARSMTIAEEVKVWSLNRPGFRGGSGYHSPTRTNKYIDVRVVVNPRTNNVITAYILDHQIDANPKLLGGCGP